MNITKSYTVNMLFGHFKLTVEAKSTDTYEDTTQVTLEGRLWKRWFCLCNILIPTSGSISLGSMTRYRRHAFQSDQDSVMVRGRAKVPEHCIGLLVTGGDKYKVNLVVDEATLANIDRTDPDLEFYQPMFQALDARKKFSSHQ